MEKVIEVNHVSFGYDGKPILKDISFFVNKGDYLGIIGANGSGKSTLLKLLLKILNLSSGEVKFFGVNVNGFNEWNKIGYIAQNATSFNSSFPASVEEVVGANLFSKIGLFKAPGKEHKELVYQALKKVGMQDYGKRLIGHLSGGQQQRVFIARALVSDPEILILDEPAAGVDIESEEALYCLLAELNTELNLTVVMVTHDIGAITIHANRFICLGENGFFEHSPKDEKTNELLTEIYGHKVHLHHDCKNCCGPGAA
jgi:zinc transport system ATP-binding protein